MPAKTAPKPAPKVAVKAANKALKKEESEETPEEEEETPVPKKRGRPKKPPLPPGEKKGKHTSQKYVNENFQQSVPI